MNTWYSSHLFMYLGRHHTFLRRKVRTCDPPTPQLHPVNSSQTVITANSQTGRFIYLFSCRQTRFSVPSVKLLSQSYTFNSLKMGCLVDLQGGPEEVCVLLFTKHPSWETAHLTSALLPKKGSNIFSTSQGASRRHSKPC